MRWQKDVKSGVVLGRYVRVARASEYIRLHANEIIVCQGAAENEISLNFKQRQPKQTTYKAKKIRSVIKTCWFSLEPEAVIVRNKVFDTQSKQNLLNHEKK